MDKIPPALVTASAIALGLALPILVMVLLVAWARRRSTGAVMAGALLSVFAPDPTFDNTVKLVEESRRLQSEEDEEGEDKDPAP
jgi:hypothetical protein